MLRDIVSKHYDPIILFVEDRNNGESFFRKKSRFDSCDSSDHSIDECSSPDASEPLLESTGVFWNVLNFFLFFLTILDTVVTELFYYCVSFAKL